MLQPPKAKGGKKGGKKGKKKTAKTPVVIDGISTEEMTKEQVSWDCFSSIKVPRLNLPDNRTFSRPIQYC